MANYSKEQKMAEKKAKTRRRKKTRKMQILANKHTKERKNRVIERKLRINNTKIIPENVEDDIMKAWNKKKILRTGDKIEIAGGIEKAEIIGASEDMIAYRVGEEKKFFRLKGFEKMITKFQLSFHHPISEIKITA